MDQPSTKPVTPYELAGGSAAISSIVSRFYELMDSEPAYAELRAIHADDLGPVREGLTQFLNAWMGGPKDWFSQGKCVMSLHREFPISRDIGAQWADAMARAIAGESGVPKDLGLAMAERLGQMARAMINAEPEADAA